MQSKKGLKVEKNVTQNDVARLAGVTRSMVSYVINGSADRSVAPETRQRILDAIEELGYRPNKAAQALQLGDEAFAAKKIGVILPAPALFLRPYYTEILEGIYLAAHENNYHISFIRFFDELKDPVLFNELIHKKSIGGLLLLATDLCIKQSEDVKLIERIKERLTKIVCVDWTYEGITSVVFDRRDAVYKACEYLFNCDYKNIGYIGHEDNRKTGAQQFLMEKGLGVLVSYPASDMQSGYSAIRQMAQDGKIPRAIVCGSDEVAIGVMRFLNEADIAVPQEVALISNDNIEISQFTNPPLTTMNVQKSAMGRRAVEMIVNDSAASGDDVMTITLPTSVIHRKSC
ncbi:MAG: LacI family transcriptional regulator [Treponema sp.]|nr:LacI family transcriptional regulator [Treponema sp.]